MRRSTHIEHHFTASETVRDIVIGMSDGLTVPFALAAGLSGTTVSSHIIVAAGLAEIAAGSIAMGLGGFLAARSDAEHYESELKREQDEVVKYPEIERAEVADVFLAYGMTPEQIEPILNVFESRPKEWVDFMMKFELGLEKPDPRRAMTSALTIAGSYISGGMIPLFPYIFIKNPTTALGVSVSVTLTALAIFGYIKGRFTGINPFKGAAQTTLIGGIAATAAFILAKFFA